MYEMLEFEEKMWHRHELINRKRSYKSTFTE